MHRPHRAFQFVNLTTPEGQDAHRHLVRSHASRNPQGRRRRVEQYQLRKGALQQPEPTITLTSAPRAHVDRVLSSSPADPFQSFPRKLHPLEWFLLHHFVGVVAASEHARYSLRPEDHVRLPGDNAVSGWVQLAAVDSGMLASILVSACRDLARQTADPFYERLCITYNAQALHSIQEALSTPESMSDDATMIKVMAAATDAHQMSDFDALEKHTNGLRSITDLRGGLDALRSSGALNNMAIWLLRDFSDGTAILRKLSSIIFWRKNGSCIFSRTMERLLGRSN